MTMSFNIISDKISKNIFVSTLTSPTHFTPGPIHKCLTPPGYGTKQFSPFPIERDPREHRICQYVNVPKWSNHPDIPIQQTPPKSRKDTILGSFQHNSDLNPTISTLPKEVRSKKSSSAPNSPIFGVDDSETYHLVRKKQRQFQHKKLEITNAMAKLKQQLDVHADNLCARLDIECENQLSQLRKNGDKLSRYKYAHRGIDLLDASLQDERNMVIQPIAIKIDSIEKEIEKLMSATIYLDWMHPNFAEMELCRFSFYQPDSVKSPYLSKFFSSVSFGGIRGYPGEFYNPQCFTIDEFTNQIYVLDCRRLLVYQENGIFLRMYENLALDSAVSIHISKTMLIAFCENRDSCSLIQNFIYYPLSDFSRQQNKYSLNAQINAVTITNEILYLILAITKGILKLVVITSNEFMMKSLTLHSRDLQPDTEPQSVQVTFDNLIYVLLHNCSYQVQCFTEIGTLRQAILFRNDCLPPISFCIDINHNIIVFDGSLKCIKVYNSFGVLIHTIVDSKFLQNSFGIAVSDECKIYFGSCAVSYEQGKSINIF